MDRVEPQWHVGWRSGQHLYEEIVIARTAVDAAETVRQRDLDCTVIAVFSLPLPRQGAISICYSDMPAQYRIVHAHRAPADGPHGYAIVTTSSSTGERSFVPGRPLSLADAEWRRDWLLRGYFEQLMRFRAGHRHWPAPIAPSIVRLADVARSSSSTQ